MRRTWFWGLTFVLGVPALLIGEPGATEFRPGARSGTTDSLFSWGDCDGDGLADAYAITETGHGGLLRNEGDGTLRDVTASAGLADVAWPRLAIWQDADGDGALDLFLGTRTGALLFVNRGDGTFDPSPDPTLAAVEGTVEAAEWVDYDRDDRPDLHLRLTGLGDRLFRNVDAGSFEEVALELEKGVMAFPLGVFPSSTETGLPTPIPVPVAGRSLGFGMPVGAHTGSSIATGSGSVSSGGGPATVAAPVLVCADALADQDGGGCLQASSTPTLGQLHPISSDLFVAPTGEVVVNGTTPMENVRLTVLADTAVTPKGAMVVRGGDAVKPGPGLIQDGGFGVKSQGGSGRDGGTALTGYGGSGIGYYYYMGYHLGFGGTGLVAQGGPAFFGGTGADIRGASTGDCGGLGLLVHGGKGYTGAPGALIYGGYTGEGYGATGVVAHGGEGGFDVGGIGMQAFGGDGCLAGGIGFRAIGGGSLHGVPVTAPGGAGIVAQGGTGPGGIGVGLEAEGSIGVVARSVLGQEAAAIMAEGRVGIGTAEPEADIHVRDAGQATLKLEADTDDAGESDVAQVLLSQDGGATSASFALESDDDLVVSSDGSPSMVFRMDGLDVFRIVAGSPPKLVVDGDVSIFGTLAKSAGTFRIDHPLDPDGKWLSHSFVESPDMLNVYNGNAVLDADGTAWVQLPEWFEALNADFRYQLTCLGAFAPVYVAEEVADNRFRIAGGHAGLEVSWQVTGIRQDEYAEANRVRVEEDKGQR